MTELELQIMDEVQAGNESLCQIINNHGDYFMDLCKSASRYLDGDREENANSIFDWLANGCEFDETWFDPEEIAKEYRNYWDC